MNPKIIYHSNGNKQYETYYNDLDQFHNESGPALIDYFNNGNISYKAYWINGVCHNTKGPAIIFYYENGTVKSKEYWLNSELIDVSSDEELQKYNKLLNIS